MKPASNVLTKPFLISTAIGAAAFVLVAPWASSQPPVGGAFGPGGASGRGGGRGATAMDYTDNTGWQSLFDGKTLDGWEGDPEFWSIRDGAIYTPQTCAKQSGTIYLLSKAGDFADFEMKFEFKGTGSINGGMQYRSYLTADTGDAGLRFAGRGGGRGASGGAGGRGGSGAAAFAAGGGGRGGSGGGGGRGNACAGITREPLSDSSNAYRTKYNMNGPQFDFDAANRWPGAFYEQGGRGTVVSPGQVVLDDHGTRTLLGTLADKATLDSWFHKDDWNQFLLIAKGTTNTMYMNGHLVSVFIDNNPANFRPSGKISIEVEAMGELFTRNVFIKRL